MPRRWLMPSENVPTLRRAGAARPTRSSTSVKDGLTAATAALDDSYQVLAKNAATVG
jgi:hypothetical protein